MERRVLIAVILSMAVLYAYQAFLAPPPDPAQKPAQSQSAPPASSPPSSAPPPATAAPAPAPAAASRLPQALVAESGEREITVETADVQAVLTNRGARIVHWRLKGYLDDEGKPVDLVPSALPAGQLTPFALRFDDPQLTDRANSAIYRVSGDTAAKLNATAAAASLVFEYQDASGLHIRKEFRFEPRDFLMTFSVAASQGTAMLKPAVTWGPGLGDAGAVSGGGSFFTGNYVQAPQAIFHQDGKVVRVTSSNLPKEPAHESEFRFAGIDDHYFLAAVIAPGRTRVEYVPVTLPGANDTQRGLIAQTFRFANPTGIKVFFGPKQFDTLRRIDAELVRAINFGIFAWLSVPLLGGLNWLYGYIGNYGWSIIALTILINLAMFPLRHKSVVSMRKMQGIQPQVQAIQARYKDLSMTDPKKQAMNTEIMNLYREKGVNPASGCVPMLLTFPILLALNSVFSQAVELRGADFTLWIHDLSRHDPYYVTPLLMGATLFWQTKMTPSTADPAQQKMMMFMPVMMTALFLNLASGLAIYYLVGNLWGVGQQYFTNWLIGPPAVQAVRPPAERRIKKAGSGKTAGAKE
jgi:YidC/Oxa1 family membrane protein insertase